MPTMLKKQLMAKQSALHVRHMRHRKFLAEGHSFFGSTTNGLAQAIEYVFQKAGRPQGYIIGEEGAGAFVGGLRYGEGTLFLKDGNPPESILAGTIGWF